MVKKYMDDKKESCLSEHIMMWMHNESKAQMVVNMEESFLITESWKNRSKSCRSRVSGILNQL